MTLRTRLVAALAALLFVGLAVFGVVTTSLYGRAQYQQLDEQLRDSDRVVGPQLVAEAGLLSAGEDDHHAEADPRQPAPEGAVTSPTGRDEPKRPKQPTAVLPTGTYAELRDPDGVTVAQIQLSDTSTQPSLPDDLSTSGTHFRTVGASSGSGSWRLMTAPDPMLRGYRLVVAIPTSGLEQARQRLILIELGASAVLLALLATGSWLILRGGLRPLERMADAAHLIRDGDVSRRVSPSDERTEVGQLGMALNTMLDGIEDAFRERDATEARLRQFLADASHELRTPITSIQGFAELFRLGAENDHVNLPVILRRIEQESARMRRLVEDLLLLARLDERRPAQHVAVDLSVLAADACSDGAAAAPNRPITLHAPRPVFVDGDMDQMRQAVTNLIANAVRHTAEDVAIEVSTDLVDGVALLIVRDHGIGLDEVALEHVFDRFWQADEARAGTGSGLGLSIVSAIATAHGGTISADNHPEGGARFCLQLPRSRSGQQPPVTGTKVTVEQAAPLPSA